MEELAGSTSKNKRRPGQTCGVAGTGCGQMVVVPILVGIIAWFVAVMALGTVLSGGTDIQIILVGVFGTLGGVCLGLAAILSEVQQIRKPMTSISVANTSSESDAKSAFGPSGERL